MIADTLSDAVRSIQEYLDLGEFDPEFETEIRRVLADMDALRDQLDVASLNAVRKASS